MQIGELLLEALTDFYAGGLIFIDLRDHYGLTQIVFDPEKYPDSFVLADASRPEYVLTIEGEVRGRPEGMTNPKMSTGKIEVLVEATKVLSRSKTPPFEILVYPALSRTTN